MQEFFNQFIENNFMPHGHCYLWKPSILWSYAISDSVIALAYLVIPLSLVRIVRRRKDFTYVWMVALFAVFILGCGTTHVFDVINIWKPFYGIDASVRIITALASIGTAVMLLAITPRLILIPSARQWEEINEELRSLNENLEQKVQERTVKLAQSMARFELQNEELKRANEELDNFLYTASHDLKTPISNLEGLINLMHRKSSDRHSEDSPLFDMMTKQVEKLRDVIYDLSEVGRIQRETEEHFEMVNIMSVLKEFEADHQERIWQANAEIHTDFEQAEFYFSEKLFTNLLHNLLDNALKYRSDERRPVIHVKTYRENEYLVVEVKDNGIGIKPEHQHKIFGMFNRFNRDQEGTGIGLYMVKKIAEKYHGKVEVESQVGQGAAFKVYLSHQP